jgi:hypothetical protein
MHELDEALQRRLHPHHKLLRGLQWKHTSLQQWHVRGQDHRRRVQHPYGVRDRRVRRWRVLQRRLRRAVRVLRHEHKQRHLYSNYDPAHVVHRHRHLRGALRWKRSEPEGVRVSGRQDVLRRERKLRKRQADHRRPLQRRWCLQRFDNHDLYLWLPNRRHRGVRHELSDGPGPMRRIVRGYSQLDFPLRRRVHGLQWCYAEVLFGVVCRVPSKHRLPVACPKRGLQQHEPHLSMRAPDCRQCAQQSWI